MEICEYCNFKYSNEYEHYQTCAKQPIVIETVNKYYINATYAYMNIDIYNTFESDIKSLEKSKGVELAYDVNIDSTNTKGLLLSDVLSLNPTYIRIEDGFVRECHIGQLILNSLVKINNIPVLIVYNENGIFKVNKLFGIENNSIMIGIEKLFKSLSLE